MVPVTLRLAVFFLVFTATVVSFAAKSKGGFGNPQARKKEREALALDPEAEEVLKRHDNDVDAASSDYFKHQMEELGAMQGLDLMEARMKTTWDTVALFLPLDYARSKGKTDKYVERRLDLIAKACRVGSILDVGCGDGAIVKYLEANQRRKTDYLGIDVSPKMVALARKQHPGLSFEVSAFRKLTTTSSSSRFDTILFNGSLQFFQDTAQTLQAAFDLLSPGGRIVMSHVNGAAFVQQECRTNPLVAVQTMPSVDRLREIAPGSANILTKTELFGKDIFLEESDVPDRSFYLMAVEKPEEI